MKVTVKYLAQAKQAAGCASEVLELDGGRTLPELVRWLAERHGDSLRRLLLGPAGAPHESLLLFVGDEQVRGQAPRELRDGEVITVLSPMAGG